MSRYAATDALLDAPAPPPTATEGFLPDFAAISGRWVNAAIATEGFLCEPPMVTLMLLIADDCFRALMLLLIADDCFLAIIAVEDRFFVSSPEDGRP